MSESKGPVESFPSGSYGWQAIREKNATCTNTAQVAYSILGSEGSEEQKAVVSSQERMTHGGSGEVSREIYIRWWRASEPLQFITACSPSW